MAAPLLVQMEADIDREMEQERLIEERMAESGGKLEDEEAWDSMTQDLAAPEPPKMFYGPEAQIITNDLKSLDEMVSTLCHSLLPLLPASSAVFFFFKY
ncbi:hypothetical protein E2C01_087525 [Portunus trituberculatus]|uniref:Uncharacterized protein n=1 Tax=Portunus trituberculatus TaxID=210409 RepID=A0A5B7JCQ1_PORTR|nr:hypothetical protein [Portunus trituberculatus]